MPRLIPYIWIICMGLGWGATLPLAKITVVAGYPPLGLIFWQLVVGVIVLGTVNLIRRRPLPRARINLQFYLFIALIGTILPNSASFIALAEVPAGIYAILIALVPMMALPLAVGLGQEPFAPLRLSGLVLGLIAVVLIIGLPNAWPAENKYLFLAIALIPPLMYACEGVFVAGWGTGGVGPIQLLLGASIIGTLIASPLALATGQFINPIRPWGWPEWAFLASALIHTVVYTCYVLVVGRYGAIFGEQVGYIVTGAGVVWSILLLEEVYAGPVWIALALMLAGLYLVQPRSEDAE